MVESATPCRFWFSDESSLFTPLIWNVAPRVPVPLKLIEEPDEAVGLFCPRSGSPGTRRRSPPARGSCRDERRPVHDLLRGQRPLISAFVRLMGGAAADRDGLRDRGGSSLKSTTRVSLRRHLDLASRTTGPKPASDALTL